MVHLVGIGGREFSVGRLADWSEPLHLVDTDCSGSFADSGRVLVHEFENVITPQTRKTSAPPKTHHETHISPATATSWRQRATKFVPRVSPYSPASVDPGFVEIGLVQLSQLVKTTNVTHTYTHRHIN